MNPRLALLFAAAAISAAQNGPGAAIAGGQIRGRALEGTSGAVFRGVPFAKPPVGELRWREPQPVASWTGVRDAGQSGPPCAQSPQGWNLIEAAASREDCLYLDVWTPEWPVKTPRPVMVWIHGGGNTAGAGGADPLYTGTDLVREGVTLVVIQYRLGALGFLAHPELTRESPHHASGNYATLDQIAALEWVRDNIAKLGGDPGNVTVFGQSAGAFNIGALMTSPLARGLFHRAIAQSGAVAGQGAPALAQAEQAGVAFAERLKAPPVNALAYLRSLSVAELLKVQSPRGFVVDGRTFTEAPGAAFAGGRQARVPYLLGGNAIEITGQDSPGALRQAIQRRYGPLAPKALALYGLARPEDRGVTDPLYGTVNDQWGADLQFRCPGVLAAKQHTAAGNAAWVYQFDRAIPPNPTVGHSSELGYVFGNLWSTGSKAGQYEDADRRLSKIMRTLWTSFAKKGDPNGEGAPAWPRWDDKTRRALEFMKTGGAVVADDPRGAACGLFIERAETLTPPRAAAPAPPQSVVIQNANVLTVTKGRFKGSILLRDGKIAALGEKVEVPEGARVLDAQGMYVMPGIIDPHSHIAAEGGVNEGGIAVSSMTAIEDVLNPEDIGVYRALAGGVTTIATMHGSANPIGGQGAILKLRWGKDADGLRVQGAKPILKMALGENVKRLGAQQQTPLVSRRYPATRMGVEDVIREAFTEARAYRESWREYEAKVKKGEDALPPRRDLKLDPLVEALDGKRIVHAHCYRADEILMLLRIGDEFGFRFHALIHVLEGYKVASEIAAHKAGASTFSDWWAYKMEAVDAIPYNAAILQRHGVLVSLNSDDAELMRHMNQEAAKLIKYGGLTEDEALAAITINPARQLDLDGRIGSIEVGKDADLAIFDQHPLSNYAKVEKVFIDGELYFDRAADIQARAGRAARKAALLDKLKEKPKETPKQAGPAGERRPS
jgi:carboxylesterase type B/imidazolonepropionase-like amidohydrolase